MFPRSHTAFISARCRFTTFPDPQQQQRLQQYRRAGAGYAVPRNGNGAQRLSGHAVWFGPATAEGVVLMVIILAITLIQFKVRRKKV